MADGPGGVRVAQTFTATDVDTGEKRTVHHFCTAWPVGTLLAQSFDPALLERVGRGQAEELSELHIAILLGPGINIHRDPLCGRNFEYFSEDPLVAGLCAAAITKGLQSFPGTARASSTTPPTTRRLTATLWTPSSTSAPCARST